MAASSSKTSNAQAMPPFMSHAPRPKILPSDSLRGKRVVAPCCVIAGRDRCRGGRSGPGACPAGRPAGPRPHCRWVVRRNEALFRARNACQHLHDGGAAALVSLAGFHLGSAPDVASFRSAAPATPQCLKAPIVSPDQHSGRSFAVMASRVLASGFCALAAQAYALESCINIRSVPGSLHVDEGDGSKPGTVVRDRCGIWERTLMSRWII